MDYDNFFASLSAVHESAGFDDTLTGGLLVEDEGVLNVVMSQFAGEKIAQSVTNTFNEYLENIGSENLIDEQEGDIIIKLLGSAEAILSDPNLNDFQIDDGQSLETFINNTLGSVPVPAFSAQPSMPSASVDAGQTEQAKSGLFAAPKSTFTPTFVAPESAQPGVVSHVIMGLEGNLKSSKSRIIQFAFPLKDDAGVEQTIKARFIIPADIENGLYTTSAFQKPLSKYTEQEKNMTENNYEIVRQTNPKLPPALSDGIEIKGFYIQEAIGFGEAKETQNSGDMFGGAEKPMSATRKEVQPSSTPSAPISGGGGFKPSFQAPVSGGGGFKPSTSSSSNDGWPPQPANGLVKVSALDISNPDGNSLIKTWQHPNGLPLIATGKIKSTKMDIYLGTTFENLATIMSRMTYYTPETFKEEILKNSIIVKNKTAYPDTRNATDGAKYAKITHMANQVPTVLNIFNYLRSNAGLLVNKSLGYWGNMVAVQVQPQAQTGGQAPAVDPAWGKISGQRAQPAAQSSTFQQNFSAFGAGGFGQQQAPAAQPQQFQQFQPQQQQQAPGVFGQVQNAINQAQGQPQQQAPAAQPQPQFTGFGQQQAPPPAQAQFQPQQSFQPQAPPQQAPGGMMMPSGKSVADGQQAPMNLFATQQAPVQTAQPQFQQAQAPAGGIPQFSLFGN